MREVNLFNVVDDLSKKIEKLEVEIEKLKKNFEILDILVEKLDIKLLDFIEEAYEEFALQCDLDSLKY